MANVVFKERVTKLEETMADLAQIAARTSEEVAQLSLEMREFKEESRIRLERLERAEERAQERAERAEERAQERAERAQERAERAQERAEERAQKRAERAEADLQAYRAEWRAEAREMNRRWGELANKMGTLAEDLVAPSLPRILREVVACPEDEAVSMAVRMRRTHPTEKGVTQEFDVVAQCGEYAIFNETKSSLTPAHVASLLNKLASARDYFPEYQPYKIIGSVASLYVDPSLVRYATRQGVLVLAVGDDLMNVMNEAGFALREF